MKAPSLPFFVCGALAAPGTGFAETPASVPINEAPEAATNAPAYAPAVLPGKWPAEHPFLYTGKWDHRKTNQTIFVVRDGRVAWSYAIPIKNADVKDTQKWPGTMQVMEEMPGKKVVWALREWKDPDLDPASLIQSLDEPGVVENGDLQR